VASIKAIRWPQWAPGQFWRLTTIVSEADEIPDIIPSRGMVLVGSKKWPKWIVFDCPCNAGHRIMLNLDTTRRPYWRIDGSLTISISPSIDFKGTLKRCHFLIIHGQIFWVKDYTSYYNLPGGRYGRNNSVR
jgi:hypothetical protein